jgi:flavin-dependent dehydrogenase
MEMMLCPEAGGEESEMVTQHVAIDKEILINGLIDEARKNHVEIFTGVNVSGAEKTDEGVMIKGNGRSFEGSFAMAADGLNSQMARKLGFNQERKFLGTLIGKVWHMQGVAPPNLKAHIHIVEGVDAPPLFCICPRAVDEYFIMVGGYVPFIDFDARLNQIMKDSWFSPWFKNAAILKEDCCVLNILSPIAEPFKNNVLLIGDACAFAQISNHNAISVGWKAANIITYALINHQQEKEGVSEYLEWWKKNFYDSHRLPPVDFMDILTREEINFVFSLFKKPIPASFKVENSKKVMAETMANIMSHIQNQRPDIFHKIRDLRQLPVEETWADRIRVGFPNR